MIRLLIINNDLPSLSNLSLSKWIDIVNKADETLEEKVKFFPNTNNIRYLFQQKIENVSQEKIVEMCGNDTACITELGTESGYCRGGISLCIHTILQKCAELITDLTIANTTNIDYIIKDSGLPNQKNYGGDLFNIPLQEVIAERNLDDAWVYVMDDDNVLHPNLFYTFNKIINNHNIEEIYGGIILTKKSMTGHVHEMHYHSICHPSTDNNIISIFNIPDPSQCILRYSFIKNNGFIPGEVNYDYKWFMPNIRNYKDQFIYYNDYNGWFSDMINAYHNNLRHLEDIEKYINDFNYKETYIDVAIQNEDTNPLNFPILKKETQEKILELIKEDLLNT